ncbi:isopenicillin N synthase family oxygenase [Candidatus Comchoanobacter bicostacola]|uniref:2-oxoglutarate-dependent ethylene/succinate-forming enzyme n=1 Tax=Candidatus Comchoanobacter bicostacola TaxID=2919598 RepID=A0ABY5DLD5_9GAMM|nr:2OG-Fe(II) oxygenase family protein [Candidatus Comchoanobacter bicostacola]UTC24592.1 isopenicillin N synthase family oxygenase [Candidatus Comchoanobacter bicostacola]
MNSIDIIHFDDPFAGKKLTHALHNTGFALIKNAPVASEAISQAYHVWEQFYQSNNKQAFKWNPIVEDGYISEEQSETAKGKTQKDLKEFYHVLKHGRCPLETQAASYALFDQLFSCGKTLLSWIQDALPSNIQSQLSMPLPKMIENSPNVVLRTIHYPPLTGNEESEAIRAAAHEDINLITILPAATASGLQVLNRNNQWINVNLDPSLIVVNTGDMLQECTAGYLKSTTHRVINPSQTANKARLSMPLFIHPRNEVRLSDRYTTQAYRKERLQENGLIQASEKA